MSKDLPFEEILARYLNREITEDQLLQESEGLDEFVRLAKMSETLQVPEQTSQTQAWSKFTEKLKLEEPAAQKSAVVKPLKRTVSTQWLSMAAAIAVLLAAFIFWPKDTKVQTSIASTERIDLPDGSEVNVFSSSEISYRKGSWDESRELKLEGEAFFQVKKGSSFVVHTGLGDVKVLGTSFNVYQRSEHFEVVCFTGKVEVSNNNQTEILLPGEKAILSNGSWVKHEIPSQQTEPNWISGKIKLQNASLSELAELIERYYGYNVRFDSELEESISGLFLTRDLENALQVICDPIELNYIFENNRTILLSR